MCLSMLQTLPYIYTIRLDMVPQAPSGKLQEREQGPNALLNISGGHQASARNRVTLGRQSVSLAS